MFIVLTTRKGITIFLNLDWIALIEPASDGVGSVVSEVGEPENCVTYNVIETMDEIKDLMKKPLDKPNTK